MKITKPVAVVRVGNIAIPIKKYPDGRFWFSHKSGEGKTVKTPRVTLEKSKQEAARVALLLSRQRENLVDLSPADVAAFKAWRDARDKSPTLGEAVKEFWAWKTTGSKAYRDELRKEHDKLLEFIGHDALIAQIPERKLSSLIAERQKTECLSLRHGHHQRDVESKSRSVKKPNAYH